MQSIDLIKLNLGRSSDIVLSRVEEMRDHCCVFPTPKGGCHTLWVLGHLAYIEGMVIRTIMLGERNPLAAWKETFDGGDVSGSVEDFPSFDFVLDTCRGTRSSTIKLLDSISESDLDRESKQIPEGADHYFGTYRKCFQYAADHWFMHRGQLADARLAAGLERMWY